MPEKFKDKYRIGSSRLRNWDYGSNGRYFITICTKNRECYFGDCFNDEMHLSEIGELTDIHWQEIPERFPYAILDEYQIMPNHMHGILIIDKNCNGGNRDGDGDCRNAINRVSTIPITATTITPVNTNPDKQSGGITGDKNPMLHDNLSRIIRWYKGRISFESHHINPDFGWQPRFHDHIIRDEKSYYRIVEYIKNNPGKWKEDKFFVTD